MNDTQAFTVGNFEILIQKRNKNNPLPSPEEAEAKLHHEGYECFQWYDVPGTIYPRHQHKYSECLWLLKGELVIKIELLTLNLAQGDKAYLPAQLPHELSIPPHSSATYLVGQKKYQPHTLKTKALP
jgi:quercetin dioxygenase-like cupin family protein